MGKPEHDLKPGIISGIILKARQALITEGI